jgi:hypothetical protein
MRFVKRTTWWVVAALLLLALSGPRSAAAQSIVLNSVADTYLRDATPRGALQFMDVRGGDIDFRSYVRFDLSSIPAGSIISGATLQLTQVPGASRNDAIVAARLATYGLNNAPGNTAQNWDEATLVPTLKGTEDVTTLTGVTDLDDNVAGITETFSGAAPGIIVTVSGAPLASFLQSRLDDGGLVTFILSNDDATDRGFGFGTRENASSSTYPALTVEYIPEPSAVAIIGVSAAALLRRRR